MCIKKIQQAETSLERSAKNAAYFFLLWQQTRASPNKLGPVFALKRLCSAVNMLN